MQKIKSEITYCNIVKSKIKHTRYSEKIHKLQETTFSILIDLENLDKVHNLSPIFSVNKFNIFSFYEKDFGPNHSFFRKKSESIISLSDYVRNLAKKININDKIKKIELLTFPRILGLSFNPLSLYRCLNSKGHERLLIYEVHNTFGECHSYLVKIKNNKQNWYEAKKIMFVSPFFKINGKYKLSSKKIFDKICIFVKYFDNKKLKLFASLEGEIIDFNSFNLIREAIITKNFPLKPLLKIHLEALKLYIKGFRFHTFYQLKKNYFSIAKFKLKNKG